MKKMILTFAAMLSIAAFAQADWTKNSGSWEWRPGAEPAHSAPAAKPKCICEGDCTCPPDKCPGGCPVSAADLAKSSVYITVDLGNGSTAGGTGTVIASEDGRSLILTNAHVVPDASHPISVTYWSDGYAWKSPATYIAGSSVSNLRPGLIRVNGPDLALIELPHPLRPVEIADAIPKPGTAVSLYGFGGAGINGTQPLHKAGKVIGDAGWTEPATLTSITTINGDSGAAVFNEAGQLVSVHWGGAGVRLDVVHAFTVGALRSNAKAAREQRVLFPRLHNRLAARAIAKSVANLGDAFDNWRNGGPSAPPPAVKSPAKPTPAAPSPAPKAVPAATPFTVTSPGSACAGGNCPTSTRRGFSRR